MAPFLMFGSPGGTGCNEVGFLVHGGWNSKYVGVTVSKSV